MPAKRLDDQPADVRVFDAVGQDADGDPHFIRHIALSEERRDDMVVFSPAMSSTPLTDRLMKFATRRTARPNWMHISHIEPQVVQPDIGRLLPPLKGAAETPAGVASFRQLN